MANEKRLIDAKEITVKLAGNAGHILRQESGDYSVGRARGIMDAVDLINKLPTVDAVEVVRCKGCKFGEPSINAIGEPSIACNNIHIGFYGWLLSEDDFCSYGERKDNA